jgi:hypothetical protein
LQNNNAALVCAVDSRIDVHEMTASSSHSGGGGGGVASKGSRAKRVRDVSDVYDATRLLCTVQLDARIDALCVLSSTTSAASSALASVDLIFVSTINDSYSLLAFDGDELKVLWKTQDERLQRATRLEPKLVRAHATDLVVGVALASSRFVAVHFAPPSQASSGSAASNGADEWTVTIGSATLQYTWVHDFRWFEALLPVSAGSDNADEKSLSKSVDKSQALAKSSAALVAPPTVGAAYMFAVLHGVDAISLELARASFSVSAGLSIVI